MTTAQEAANKLYPPNHPVEDDDYLPGSDEPPQSDPYGYDELGNKAFLEGTAWQAAQFRERLEKMQAEWDSIYEQMTGSPRELDLALSGVLLNQFAQYLYESINNTPQMSLQMNGLAKPALVEAIKTALERVK